MSVHPQPNQTGDDTPGWPLSDVVDGASPAPMDSMKAASPRGRPRPPIEGSRRLGRFQILDTLGSGGMGVVLEAYDDLLDRTVALKVLHPWGSEQHRARLLREAKALARLSHPNVVQVYEVGTVGDDTFIAMELVRGQNLRDWARKPHPWRTTVDVYVQAGEGLAAAHAEGIVHRDFKPDNCIIGDNGRVRVLDFGLARELDLGGSSGEGHELSSERVSHPYDDEDDGAPRKSGDRIEPVLRSGDGSLGDPLTVTGTLLGTVAYMPYEQLRGRSADALSDQFSFCASLWEALYGVRAFSGSSPYALVTSLKLNRLNPIPEDAKVPRRLRQVLVRGLALDPARRWPSMQVLLERLREVARRRRWWRTAALVAVGVGLGVGSLALLGNGGETDVCAEPEAGLEGAWGPEDRAAVQQAFDTHVPPDTAPVLRARVMGELDAYVREWADHAQAACRATFVTHQQSELSFDRRMRCLARGRNRLRSTIDALAGADNRSELVQRAILAFKLPDLTPCADLEALEAEHPPPSEPVLRERAADLRRRIDEAHTLRDGGMTAQGVALAQRVRDEAVALADPLVLAEALECLGRLQAESEHTAEAVTTLADAVIEAERISADQVAARAWLSMLYALSMERDLPTAQARVLAARAAVERTGDETLRAWWLNNVGILYAELKQYEEADDHLRQALELKSRIYGPGHVDVGIAWSNLGTLRMNANDLAGAAEAFDHAQRVFEATVSAAHPLSASVESGRCRVDERLGNHAAAIVHCNRALSSFEVSPAPPVIEYRTRRELANALWGAGRYEQARRTAQEARTLGLSIGPAEAEQMERWFEEHGAR
jgi:eukaryotic-like serine/threonine-protein kinase